MYRILVVDDEKIERMVLCKTLQKQFGDCIQVFQAKSGKEALEIFEKNMIQIAILDIEMPGMNGLEAARQMRKMSEDCVILFLTAFAEFSYAKQAITVKALDYLLKPYDEKELTYVIEEAMHQIDENNKTEQKELLELTDIMKSPKAGDIRLSLVKETVEKYIADHYAEDISMSDLAHAMNYSEPYFCKLFKQCFRVNFTSYLAEYRISVAKAMLEDQMVSIKEVGKACGYADSNYFTRVFKRATGLTPSEYRLQKSIDKRE